MKQLQNTNGDDIIPLEFHLSQNHPNPFKNATSIKYCVAYKTRVMISILNSCGDPVEVLVDENQDAGTYKIEFSVKNKSYRFPGGVYSYELKSESYSCKKEMIHQP